MIGSALRFAEANAIGAAPTTITPIAPSAAMDQPLSPAKRRPAVVSHAGSRDRRLCAERRAGRPSLAPACRGRGCRGRLGLRRGGQRQVAGGEQQDQRDHAVRVGAERRRRSRGPRSAPSRPGRTRRRRDRDPRQPRVAAQRAHAERRADRGERDDRDQVDREPVRGGEVPERRDERRPARAAATWPPSTGPCRPAPLGLPVRCALPEAAPRPGLEQRHAEEEHARPAEQSAGRSAATPRRARAARSARPATDVDEHRARRAEQHGQPGREDPAERLAERPDDQPPGHAGQPGEPGRPAAHARRSATCPMPTWIQTDRRAGLDRVVGPDGAARSSPGAAPSRARSPRPAG